MYAINSLSREFNLSRSTLLYYDNIGLLKPSGRSINNYRQYSEEDKVRLGKICTLREAGISLEEIKAVLTRGKENEALTKRLQELNRDIKNLRLQQKLIIELLKERDETEATMLMDAGVFKKILHSIGFDEGQLDYFHIMFEKNAPDSHRFFLEFLGFSDEDIQQIKEEISSKNIK